MMMMIIMIKKKTMTLMVMMVVVMMVMTVVMAVMLVTVVVMKQKTTTIGRWARAQKKTGTMTTMRTMAVVLSFLRAPANKPTAGSPAHCMSTGPKANNYPKP